MIIRLVHLHFDYAQVDTFLRLFEEAKPQILQQPGCSHLELLQDLEDPSRFLTYSHWENDEDLQAYRNSPFFIDTWQKTRPLFASPPQANSFHRHS